MIWTVQINIVRLADVGRAGVRYRLRMVTPFVSSECSIKRRHSWVTRLFTVAVIAGALVIDRSSLVVVPALFVLVVPFEKVVPRHRQRLRRPGLATDIAYGLSLPGLRLVGVAIGFVLGAVSLLWLPGLALRPLVAMLPPGLKAVAGLLLVDVAAYWAHRFSHEIPLLWRFHAVHHLASISIGSAGFAVIRSTAR